MLRSQACPDALAMFFFPSLQKKYKETPGIMTLFINNKPVTIFAGATLEMVVLRYSRRSHSLLKSGYLGLYDRFGNPTEPDGPVSEGQHFFLKVIARQG